MSWRHIFNAMRKKGHSHQDVLNMTPYTLLMYWKDEDDCDPFAKKKGRDENDAFVAAVKRQNQQLADRLAERLKRG